GSKLNKVPYPFIPPELVNPYNLLLWFIKLLTGNDPEDAENSKYFVKTPVDGSYEKIVPLLCKPPSRVRPYNTPCSPTNSDPVGVAPLGKSKSCNFVVIPEMGSSLKIVPELFIPPMVVRPYSIPSLPWVKPPNSV